MGFKILITIALALSSCSDAQFKSSGSPAVKAKPQAAPFKPQAFGDAMPQKNSAGVLTENFPLSSVSQSQPIDIIFVVDTSRSMMEEKSFLEQKMSFFVQNLTANTAADYKIYMIGENFNFPATFDYNRFQVINRYVGSHDALTALSEFLNNSLGTMSFQRQNAVKHAVIISDDNAGSGSSGNFGGIFGSIGNSSNGSAMSAMDFKNRIGLVTQPGKLHIHGFVGLNPGQNNSWCNIEGVGSEYIQLANDPMFKGQIQDLCNSNWDSLLGNLASNIIQLNTPTSHTFMQPLDSTRPLTVSVNGLPVPPSAYLINYATNSLLVNNPQSFPPNSNVMVEYYPRP
jgi:hypothetical protein